MNRNKFQLIKLTFKKIIILNKTFFKIKIINNLIENKLVLLSKKPYFLKNLIKVEII
jgi:hypothetical protein